MTQAESRTKRVLLTGATGFIGRHCLPGLRRRGYEVHAVTHTTMGLLPEEAIRHRADLLDARQVEALMKEVQPTHLLHFAWYAAPGLYWTSPENFRWVQASLSLLQAFVHNGGLRAVMAGTCAEYDWNYGYCAEKTTPLRPKTFYGACKQALQSLLTAYAEQVGLSSAWGRIFFVYGPNEHPNRLVAYVVRSLLQGETARCSHGAQIRDFLHVEDVADAFVTLLGSEVSGSVNIASGQPVTLKEVLAKIAVLLNGEERVELGAVPAAEGEPPLLVADVRRLTREVGWTTDRDLDRGLAETIDWWRDQLRKENE